MKLSGRQPQRRLKGKRSVGEAVLMDSVRGLKVCPTLGQLSAGDSPDNDPAKFDSFAFGNHVLDRDVDIGKSFERGSQVPFGPCRAGWIISWGVGAMFPVFGGKVSVGNIQVLAVNKLFKMLADEFFILLETHDHFICYQS